MDNTQYILTLNADIFLVKSETEHSYICMDTQTENVTEICKGEVVEISSDLDSLVQLISMDMEDY